MHSKVQKWGNSLALRIPKAFALEVGLREDADVEVSIRQGILVVAPLKAPTYNLNDLLAKVNRRNLHGEVDLGPASGREAWSVMAYVPERGHFIWLTFTPQAGHEQAGRRPALVLSPPPTTAKSAFSLPAP